MGITAMALTDINNSSGTVDFVNACIRKGIKPVAGMEFRQGNRLLFVCLARNPDGFNEINRFRTEVNLGKVQLSARAPGWENVFVIYPLENLPAVFRENEYAGIRPAEAGRLIKTNIPAGKRVALQPVTFDTPEDFILHQNLRAIDHNLLLNRLKPGMTATADETFPSPATLMRAFARFPEIPENSRQLLEKCNIHFDFPKNKVSFTSTRAEDFLLLEKLANEGFRYRYGENNPQAHRRLLNELEVIKNLDFAAYFLITHDIIRYAMRQGIHHVGRGSGANSLVAYCLRITDVDPMALGLYFERFMNPKRTSPPDFDIDFSWKEREQIQHYVFQRYPEGHVALLGTTVTFKKRSVYRELAKVHGLPKDETDRLAAHPEQEASAGKWQRHIHHLAQRLAGFPNQRSIHAGGILISEKPLYYFTALDLPPKGMPVTQWDMYVAEMLGFEKLDILSQRGIGHLQEAVEIITRNHRVQPDIHNMNALKTDEKTKSLLRRGETIGCFYIESPAMRGLLKKLHCDDYKTLVAASSIIRPGVARSGMMREYIRRFHHPQNFKYLHPVFREQLGETYGVMVYQEDVLKVCHHFAGLDLADADILRRAMSGKYRGKAEFLRIKNKFFEKSRKQGHPDKIIAEVWRQIESFAGYSFSKAHSASYAVESFQSLFLKAHFPMDFMVAVINNFGGFYPTWVYFNELRRLGGDIHLPCVNHSRQKTGLRGNRIFIGFTHIKGIEKKTVARILSSREEKGPFRSLADFVHKVEPGLEQLILLIRTGALRFTGKNKPELLWEAHFSAKADTGRTTGSTLFDTTQKSFSLPRLATSKTEDAYDELELLGFPVSLNWFDLLQTRFRGEIYAGEMMQFAGKTVRMLGLLVTIKNVRTQRNETMHFATFIDARGEMFDTIHFPPALKRYPFRGNGIYLLLGKVTEEFNYATLEVQKMAKMPLTPDPRES